MVTVPTGTAAKIVTSNASINVTGRCDLLLRYGSAVSRTTRVSGSVTVRSGSGDAHFGLIEGSLQHVCASGLVAVAEAHGSVRSRSGSGSARLAAVYGDVDLASGSRLRCAPAPAVATSSCSEPPDRRRTDQRAGAGSLTRDTVSGGE
jgi:hypothetical protein